MLQMRPLTAPPLFIGLATLLLASTVHAQLYRSIGSDGRVTYSDKPPVAAHATPASGAASSVDRSASNQAGLPYQLRQIAQRYPVTLYTSSDCAPCNTGRNLLINRGVPFNEKTISTQEDIKALQRLTGGESSLPLLTIGSQHLKGYADTDWSQYLDAAGYPKTSQLPSTYQRAVASPMVAVQTAPAPMSPEEPAPVVEKATSPSSHMEPPRNSANPAGIRF